MLMRLIQRISSAALVILFVSATTQAQARATYLVNYPAHCPASDETKPELISITFKDAIKFAVDEKTPSEPRYLIYYEDSNDKVLQYWSKMCYTNDSSFGIVNLYDFRTGPADTDPQINLASTVAAGGKRNFLIVLKPVMLPGDAEGGRIQTAVKIPSPSNQPPVLTMVKPKADGNRELISIQPYGISPSELAKRFASSPEKIVISYQFADADTVPSFSTYADGIQIDPESPYRVAVKPHVPLSKRPEGYNVTVKFPTADLKGSETNQSIFKVPTDDEFLEASLDISLKPDVPKRADSEFFFETAFTSIVNPKNRSRGNVGVFGLHLKPTIKQLTKHIHGENEGAPTWFALRPLFDADVDTQAISDSESPNRITFGIDGELGRNVGLNGGPHFLPFFIWTNGFRYDSDRDFKLQTAYWHTEFVPYFFDFEKTREQTLHQYRYPNGVVDAVRKGRQPFVSAYRFRPMIGYDLGKIVKRDSRLTSFPTNTISRVLAGFDAQLEFKRLVTFDLTNTYYFLENLNRRKSRDYLEAGLELNTGYLFRRDLRGLQNAISFTFKRGEQPPTFRPVNSFSIGFKIFK
jgi:hypothetical protein